MIGVFGGTFDPPHLGHIHLVRTLLQQFQFSKLYLVPNYQNPLKQAGPSIEPENRLMLVKAAFQDLDSRIEILDWEISQQKPSYTIDTIKHLKSIHSDPLSLIVGNDVLKSLPKWKSISELCGLVDWIVIKRSDGIVPDPQQLLHEIGMMDAHWTDKNHLAYSQNKHSFRFCDIQALPFSSTQLRLSLGELWKKNELANLPQGIQRSVWLLIKEKRLYAVG